jgi:hypothetical protein
MGSINIELFATLDLVGQSPGGPDEDPVGFRRLLAAPEGRVRHALQQRPEVRRLPRQARPLVGWVHAARPDLAGAVREIRDRHEHVKVVGSLNLVQTLLREKLFDRLDLWVYPIVLGVGKKVFDGGAVPTNLTLLEPPAASPKGTVYLRYGRADGTPATGGHERHLTTLDHCVDLKLVSRLEFGSGAMAMRYVPRR